MKKNERIYYLDFIRAMAMIAGVFFHSSLSFLIEPVKDWPIYDQQISLGVIDLLTWALHRIRMPLFFIVCGYFTSLLLTKYSTVSFLKNRLKKVFIPLVLGLILIVPISINTFMPNMYFAPYSFGVLKHFSLMHLWFLYYLIFFYLLFLSIKKLYPKIINKTFILVAIMTTLFLMKSSSSIDGTANFIIRPIPFLFYFSFYLLGSIYFKEKNLFVRYKNIKTKFIFILSFLLTPILILKKADNSIVNIFTILFIFSSIVLIFSYSRKFMNKSSSIIRYISDSSYWIYLIHIPIVVTLQKETIQMNIMPEAKFLLTSLISLVLLFFSYHAFVRYSFIGTFLHGKRNKNENSKKSLAWN